MTSDPSRPLDAWARGHVDILLDRPPSVVWFGAPDNRLMAREQRDELERRDARLASRAHDPDNARCSCGGCIATAHYRTAERAASFGCHAEAQWRQRLGDSWYLGTRTALAELEAER
jgi:hypothetical protein